MTVPFPLALPRRVSTLAFRGPRPATHGRPAAGSFHRRPRRTLPVPTSAAPAAPKTVWSEVRVNGPYIAMTFDDGPSKALTPQLLDILKERHMHVTFFVVGQNAKDHPEILKRAIDEGHEIGNHSWSHPNFAKMSDDAVKSELDRTKDAIMAANRRQAGDADAAALRKLHQGSAPVVPR